MDKTDRRTGRHNKWAAIQRDKRLTCNSLAITDSISSPTYPACVRVVQSQMASGTSKHLASVWASSVFPGEQRDRPLLRVC